MKEMPAAGIEQVLLQAGTVCRFLSQEDLEGGWRGAFGEGAARLPQPYWLYADDEQTPLIVGFPLKISTTWEAFCRELGQLVEAETSHRCALALGQPEGKTGLIELRGVFARRMAELLENALLHDHDRRLVELLWLAVSRETAERLAVALRGLFSRVSTLSRRSLDEIRYAVARRIADVSQRGETEAQNRLRRWGAIDPVQASLGFSARLRSDLVPFAEERIGPEEKELDSYLHGHLRIEPARFHGLLATTSAQLERLRQRDPSFDRVLDVNAPEIRKMRADRLLYARPVLNLIEAWGHPETPRLSSEMLRLLRDLGDLLRRFEVVATLRQRIFPVGLRGSRAVTRIHGQFARLSGFTRPIDFTSPGVVDTAVRRYGLLYDLVEFTQLLEELRRRGRGAEEHAMRFMVRFQREVEELRSRHRLKFEKFLGDGAFYSARSARAVLLAAAELRILYERLCHQGFPFERGLRLAVNVGVYHLLPMTHGGAGQPHFEFFGHGLVELARLTTGKTTHEVEDIADFLIAAGYQVQRVLEFLEPVRQSPRYPDHVRERPYSAFLVENRELVNLGGVATEAFLRDLETEWAGLPIAEGERYGLHWILLPCDSARLDGPWVGLRPIGTARLKGLEPTPLAEMVVFEQPPEGMTALPEGYSLAQTLQRLGGDGTATEAAEQRAEAEVDPQLCVVSALENAVDRAWYIGLYDEELDALLGAFRVPLNPVDLKDGEPFEAWLFRRRGELGKLYQGLRRDGAGASVALEGQRGREGYFSCLLAAPHRSPR
ncbi:MAG: hypothetical protein V1750_05430 [Acidobacteriota bacterium]